MKIRKMKPQVGRWYIHDELVIYIQNIVCTSYQVKIRVKLNKPDLDKLPYKLRRKIHVMTDQNVLNVPHFQFFREFFREATEEETLLYKAQSI